MGEHEFRDLPARVGLGSCKLPIGILFWARAIRGAAKEKVGAPGGSLGRLVQAIEVDRGLDDGLSAPRAKMPGKLCHRGKDLVLVAVRPQGGQVAGVAHSLGSRCRMIVR